MNTEEIKSYIKKINDEQFKNVSSIISVSKMLDFLARKFDAEKQALICEEKGKTDSKYKYAGMTAAEIMEQWSSKAAESMKYGRLLDTYAGLSFKDTSLTESLEVWKLDNNFDYDDRLKNNCTGFDEFVADMTAYGYEYVGREMTVYLRTENGNVVTGRLDCLFRNPSNGRFLIVDWKTTDDIKLSGFGNQKFFGPGMDIDDCDMSKYTTQLHIYKEALCNTYGLGKPDDISVAVVNLRKEAEANGRHYLLYKENFQFKSKRLHDFVDFAIKKRALLSTEQK